MDDLDVVIPGAQKAGTSTLLSVLARHDSVERHPAAELGALLEGGEALSREVAVQYGPRTSRLRLAKSAGLMHDEAALRDLVTANPQVRLLVMLRDPVARAVSSFWYAKRTGDERLDSLADAIEMGSPRPDVPSGRQRWVQYLERSEYLEPLRLMRDLVGESRLHIVLLEDYHDNPARVIHDIETWLDIPHQPVEGGGSSRVNAAAEVRSQRMARFLRSSNSFTRTLRTVIPSNLSRAIRRKVISLNEREMAAKPRTEPALIADLHRRFAAHNAMLSEEFGLDLGAWGEAAE